MAGHRRHVGRRLRQRRPAERGRSKLVAAFNHLHIFIDPDPDPEKSFRERERLFALPRSSWRDYDAALISKGGGIFDRSAKAIPLSPGGAALLDIEGDEPSRRGGDPQASSPPGSTCSTTAASAPTSRRRVGGATREVGDRANDRVRVDGTRGARPGDRRGRQPRAHPEGPARVLGGRRPRSTPTPSTTRAGSTPPTTR